MTVKRHVHGHVHAVITRRSVCMAKHIHVGPSNTSIIRTWPKWLTLKASAIAIKDPLCVEWFT